MKKLFSTIALFAVMLVVTSAKDSDMTYLTEGDKAPALRVENSSGAIDLKDCKGEYVLLTFWSTSDAQSRSDCNMYSSWFKKNAPENVKHISVNFDFERILFDEIVKLDNLDADTQFNLQGIAAAKLQEEYNLQEGYGSVLIDREGRIKRFNPSVSELTSL